MDRRSGIAVRLLASLLLLAVIPATIVGILAYRSSSRLIRDQVGENLKLEAALLGHEVDSFIDAALSELLNLSESSLFTNPYSSLSERRAQLENIVLGSDILCAYQVDSRGRVLVSAGLTEDPEVDVAEILARVEGGELYTGECSVSPLLHKPTITIAAPLFYYGSFRGAIIQEIDMAAIQRIVDSYAESQKARGYTGYAYIVDREGLIIAHPDREMYFTNAAELGIPELTAAVGKMTAGEEGLTVYTFSDVESLVVYRPMQGHDLYRGSGWSIAAKAPTAEVYEDVFALRSYVVILVVLAVVVAVIAGTTTARKISTPLAALSKAAATIAEGDLSVQIPPYQSDDEIGVLTKSFEAMVSSLRELAKGIWDTAEEVVTMSEELKSTASVSVSALEQISTTMQQLAAGAEDQSSAAMQMVREAETLLEGASTVAEGGRNESESAAQVQDAVNGIAASINEALHAVSEIRANADENAVSASSGLEAISRVSATMDKVSADTESLASIISRLGDHSEEIGRIVQVITEISSQTNLLALNAAIEAARAGEHGKGFAVVAEEVRKLAEDSSKEAKLIAEQVQGIRRAIENAVRSVNTVAQEVGHGSEVVNHAGGVFQGISEGASRVTSLLASMTDMFETLRVSAANAQDAARSIAAIVEKNAISSVEMVESTEKVRQLIDSVAAVSEENAASVQEVAASTEEVNASSMSVSQTANSLAELAAGLRDIVTRIKVGD